MALKNPDQIIENLSDDSIYFGDSDLWTAAASGDKEFLDKYYKGGGKTNQKFNGFGRNHSLIMAAARNQLPDIVKFLEEKGETTLSPSEANELSLLKNKWGWETGDDYSPIEIVDPNYDWKSGGYSSFEHYKGNVDASNNMGRAIHNRQKEWDTLENKYRNKEVSLDDWINGQKSIFDKYQGILDENYKLIRGK